MKLKLAFLILATSVVGCSDDATTPATSSDTGSFGDGPITERPDDGVDTNTGATDSAVADTGMGDTTVADTGAGDTGAADTKPAPDALLPDTAGGVTVVTVGAGGLTFVPSTVTIKPGETVRWVFSGAGHNVVSGTGCTSNGTFCNPSDTSCATAPTAGAGTTYEHTFATAGTFPYFCAPHCGAGMTGSVVVAP